MDNNKDILERIEQLEENHVKIQGFLDEFSKLSKIMLPTIDSVNERLAEQSEKFEMQEDLNKQVFESITQNFELIQTIGNSLSGKIEDDQDFDLDDEDDYDL